MGTRKARAKAFKQHTDKAINEEVKEANLLSGKGVESDYYVECLREPDNSTIRDGDRVRLIDMKDKIEVFIGQTSVGYVLPTAVTQLRDAFQIDKSRTRSISGKVVEVSELTPTFVISLGAPR